MGKGGFLICIGPVCIPIQALYGALPVLYLLWDRIRPFFAALFPSVFPPLEDEEVDTRTMPPTQGLSLAAPEPPFVAHAGTPGRPSAHVSMMSATSYPAVSEMEAHKSLVTVFLY